MPDPKLAREVFDILMASRGLPLDEAKKAELYTAAATTPVGIRVLWLPVPL